jgi:1,2-dihydroxy-3-keto-5-methylthiopentene dioxygenase
LSLFSIRFDEESFAKNPDQRLPHSYQPERPASIDELKKLGVLYWSIPTDKWEPDIDRVAKERDYKNRDRLNVSKEGLGDQYEEKLKTFFSELVSSLALRRIRSLTWLQP